jgi:RNA-binding protein YhbY
MDYTEEFKRVLLSEPHEILGKKGITQEFINHTIKLLKRYKTIKIKALKSIANKSNIKELASQIAKLTESNLLDVRGFTFIITKYAINKIP